MHDVEFGRIYRAYAVYRVHGMHVWQDLRFSERCCLYLEKQYWTTSIRNAQHSVTSQNTGVVSDECLLTGYLKTLHFITLS